MSSRRCRNRCRVRRRPSFAEEMRRPTPPPIAAERERRSDPLAGVAAEPLGRIERPEREPRPEPRLEPRAESRPEPRAEPRAEPRPEPMPPMPPRDAARRTLMPRPNRPGRAAEGAAASCRTYRLLAFLSQLRHRCRRAPIRISPRWRSVSKPHFGAPQARLTPRLSHRSHRPDAAHAPSPRQHRPELRQKRALKISKTRWPRSLAVQSRRLREARAVPA